MTRRSTPPIVLVLLLSLLAAPSAATAAEIVVFGDSWAEGAADELQAAVRAAGLDLEVAGYGVGGTTAEVWAAMPAALPDAVALNPDARWLWLSIGGNDIFASHAAGEGSAADGNDRNIRAMLAALHDRHPDLRVVMMAYDFPNFEQSQACIANAIVYFGPVTTPVVNQIFLDEVGAVQARIAEEDARLSFVEVWGTLQAAGGVPGAPNLLRPSPSRTMADCIHPTGEGYRILHDRLVAAYWGAAPPIAACGGCATQACRGEPVTLTSTSAGASDTTWRVGERAATGDALTWTPTEVGRVEVQLTAHRMAWTDAITHAVEVADCSAPEREDVGIPEDASADVGDLADAAEDTGGRADAPEGDAAPARDSAGGDDAAAADIGADGSAFDSAAPGDVAPDSASNDADRGASASGARGDDGCAVALGGDRAPSGGWLVLVVGLLLKTPVRRASPAAP